MMRLQAQFILLIAFVFTIVLVHTQDQSGFISIDCGAPTKYSDPITTINYVPDAEYLETGTSIEIAPEYKTNSLEQQFYNVRSFPDGSKNCYTLTPLKVDGSTKYLVRARFMYGNYDQRNVVPKFDIYLGVDYWDTLNFHDVGALNIVSTEVIYIPSSNLTYICLVNTGGGTPFISALELRLLNLDSRAYAPPSSTESLKLSWRLDMGSSSSHRYPDDIYDRIWKPAEYNAWTDLSTTQPINSTAIYTRPPSIIMSTAVTPTVATEAIEFKLNSANPSDQYYLYFYFSDFQKMEANQSREMNIYLNDDLWYDQNVTPEYLRTNTIYGSNSRIQSSTSYKISISKTTDSMLPPIINAFEAYIIISFTHTQTEREDVNAMKSIKSTYKVKKNWQGDPCVPQTYSWEGLDCSNDGSNPHNSPRIIFLNLSSSGLTGEISECLSNLTALQSLDLSCNSLSGTVPYFFSEMASLRVLNLTGNNLTGSLPAGLVERRNQGTLIIVDDNPGLCSNDTRSRSTTAKKSNIIVPIVISLGGILLILMAAAAAILWRIKKRKQKGPKDTAVAVEKSPKEHRDNMSALITNTKQPSLLNSRNQQVTYMDILRITNNFERVVGRGGSGNVYHGYVDDIQVAVKMLSLSSIQGHKQFHSEAKLLMRVHHRNLISLVGYCEEGDKLGVIYEYMANGNLQTHLSAKNPQFLSWETRLSIAHDAAQGLEYLHNGCKPPIIHRDVKSANILLNESFQAKLSDFGLSRSSPIAGATSQVSMAGTPGYLDPEYWNSQRMSEKSDVFGYGVVLLEIITGQPPISKEECHLSQSVRNTLSTSGDVTRVIDPRLRDNCDINSVWRAVEIAMDCVSPSSTERPKMNKVVNELQQCLDMEKARTNTGNETEPTDSIEFASLNIHTGTTPLAR